MKTASIKQKEIQKKWLLIDIKSQVLGRVASQISHLLMGKHKPDFVPHLDSGDFVIVTNAKYLHLTGKKWKDKIYYHHTHHPGGLKSICAEDLARKYPERLIQLAVKGMLPKNKLRKKLLTNLRIYHEEAHPHHAQKPEKIAVLSIEEGDENE